MTQPTPPAPPSPPALTPRLRDHPYWWLLTGAGVALAVFATAAMGLSWIDQASFRDLLIFAALIARPDQLVDVARMYLSWKKVD